MTTGTPMSGPSGAPGRRFVRALVLAALLALAAGSLLALAGPAGAATYTITPGGPSVTVTIATADENQFLTFTGTAGQRVSLKVGPTCCSTKVSIRKPDGTTLVGATSIGTSGGFIDARTLPLSGTYTILVDPQTSATGSVTITLYDVPPDVGGTIVPGGPAATVTTTTPGQNARLTFDGTAGQRVSLKIGPTCCGVRISVLNPSGTTLAGPTTFTTSGGFFDTKTLPVTGKYTIVVDPQSSAVGSVTLTLYDVPPDAVATIAPGGLPVTITTTTPGQNARLTFFGTAGQRVSLKIGPVCCRTNVSITRPDGDPLVGATSVSTSGGFIDTRTLPVTGTYTILVDPQSFAVGDVTLTLYDVPADVTGTIVPGGAAVTVAIGTPGQNARLTFAGTTGGRISLRMSDVTIGSSQFGGTRVSVLKPDGTSFVSAVNAGTAGQFVDTRTLPASGTYTIVIDPQSSNTGSMRLTLYDVPADVAGTIVPGGPAATVTTTTPGQNARLTFDGTAGQRVSLKIGPTCCATKVSVLSPDGTALVGATSFTTSGGFIDARTLPATGTYTIVVDPQSFAAGSVTLTLYDVPPDVTRTIVPGGAPVTVTISAMGQNARLTFAGTAGRAVSLKMSDVTIGTSLCCSTKVSILKPDGTALVGPMNVGTSGGFIDTKRLPATGTYTILIDPQSASTGSLTLRLYDVPADVAATIVPGGGSVTVMTTVPGENARLTFDGTAGRRISLRLASCCATKVSISSPDGSTLVPATAFGAGTGFVDTRTLPATGTYTIAVDPQGDATGDMTLTLYDVPPDVTGAIVAGGGPVTVTTTTPGQNALVTFSGAAGDGVKHTVGPFNCCSTKISIRNPDGTTLVAPIAFNPDGGTVYARLPATGTYGIFVDPQGPNVGSVHLRLELDNTPPADPILTLTESSAASHAVGTSFFYRPSGSGGTFAVGATTSDGVSGIQKVRFPGLSGGFTPTTFTDDTASPYSQTYTWTTGATYESALNTVSVFDRVGNVSTAAFAVTRDAGAPTTADDSGAIGSAWKNTSQTVTLTPSDALAGVAATHYTSDGSTPTASSPQGTAVSLTADGVWTVKYFSVDNVGNQESVKTAGTQIRIDKTKPATATLSALASVIKNGQVLTGSGSDALSGVASVSYYYCAGSSCTPSTLIGSSSTGPSYSVTWSSQPADGAYQVLARVVDTAGNFLDSAKRTVTIDNTAPNTTITAGPSNPTNQTSASFSFTSSESGSTFECRLDGGTFASCTSPWSYSTLAAGSHMFEVRSTDPVGNTDATAATYTWTIDLTAPDTTITGSPADPSSATSANFTFTSTETGSTFQCALDGAAFSACTSPRSYAGLTDGSHTFQVRAIDPAGNHDAAPASYTWMIDATAPNTTITAAPTDPTNSTSASFAFAASEAGSTFQCALDGGPFSVCSSPAQFELLAEGSHTFHVKATDGVGNTDPTPAAYTWTVDVAAPETTITAGPPNPTNSATATFSFASSEAGSSFQCALDGGAFAACTSPTTYTALPAGSHTFDVKATDAAGNADTTPASYTWTIDVTEPETSISSGPSDPTNAASASFVFTADKAGSTFECSLDGGAFASCTSPKSYGALAAGSHTFAVRATDLAGNTDATPASHAWTIDLAAPETTITSAPTDPTNSTSASFAFAASESGSTFDCSLDGAAFTTCASPKTYAGLAAGSHTFRVRATDPAGNVDATPASATWRIDEAAPDTTITVGPPDPTNSTSATFEFAASEAGSTFECSLDGVAYASCASPKTYTGLAGGNHTFAVRATDPAGNPDATPASRSWTVDLDAPAAPVIETPPNGSTSATGNFTLAGTAEAGSRVEIFEGAASRGTTTAASDGSWSKALLGIADGSHTYTARATDAAGNTSPASAERTILVDTSPPNTTIEADPAPFMASTSAFFSFSADDAAATFECSLDGAAYVACSSPKTYTGLAEGPHSFRVRATDSAGNTDATPATSNWTVDLTAPAAPTIASPVDGTTNTTRTIAFSGTAEPGTFVELYDGATRLLGAATANSSGNWTKNVSSVGDGSHTYTATATDPAGNTSPASEAVTVTVDATAPNTTITSSPADPTAETQASFEFVASEAGSSFECSLDGAAFTACTSPSDYAGLVPGTHTFAVRATDGAGNTDQTPATHEWTVT